MTRVIGASLLGVDGAAVEIEVRLSAHTTRTQDAPIAVDDNGLSRPTT